MRWYKRPNSYIIGDVGYTIGYREADALHASKWNTGIKLAWLDVR